MNLLPGTAWIFPFAVICLCGSMHSFNCPTIVIILEQPIARPRSCEHIKDNIRYGYSVL